MSIEDEFSVRDVNGPANPGTNANFPTRGTVIITLSRFMKGTVLLSLNLALSTRVYLALSMVTSYL
jgi:hypothetical protein